jgi:hypothetical protein
MVLPHHLYLPSGVETTDESKIYVACAGEEGIVKVGQINDSKMIYIKREGGEDNISKVG